MEKREDPQKISVKGVTLVELMVALAITSLLSIAGYTFYVHTLRFQVGHERQKDMRTRLQLGMDLLVREIRHAGYGITDPVSNRNTAEENPCPSDPGLLTTTAVFNAFRAVNICEPVRPGSGGTTAPDTITILQVGEISFGRLFAPVGVGGEELMVESTSSITLTPGITTFITLDGLYAERVADGGIALIGGENNKYKVTLVNPIVFPGSVQGEDDGGGFPSGTYVLAYTVPVGGSGGIEFSIGNNPEDTTDLALLRDGGLFVSGIEDLQVAYLLSENAPPSDLETNDPVIVDTANPYKKQAYLALRISMIARVLDPDSAWASGQRPALEDREAGVAGDRFRRVLLTRVVELRNDACESWMSICS